MGLFKTFNRMKAREMSTTAKLNLERVPLLVTVLGPKVMGTIFTAAGLGTAIVARDYITGSLLTGVGILNLVKRVKQDREKKLKGRGLNEKEPLDSFLRREEWEEIRSQDKEGAYLTVRDYYDQLNINRAFFPVIKSISILPYVLTPATENYFDLITEYQSRLPHLGAYKYFSGGVEALVENHLNHKVPPALVTIVKRRIEECDQEDEIFLSQTRTKGPVPKKSLFWPVPELAKYIKNSFCDALVFALSGGKMTVVRESSQENFERTLHEFYQKHRIERMTEDYPFLADKLLLDYIRTTL